MHIFRQNRARFEYCYREDFGEVAAYCPQRRCFVLLIDSSTENQDLLQIKTDILRQPYCSNDKGQLNYGNIQLYEYFYTRPDVIDAFYFRLGTFELNASRDRYCSPIAPLIKKPKIVFFFEKLNLFNRKTCHLSLNVTFDRSRLKPEMKEPLMTLSVHPCILLCELYNVSTWRGRENIL